MKTVFLCRMQSQLQRSENKSMFDIESIKYDEKGLVPAITVDALTNEVLMQAFMNKEAIRLTLETQEAHYFSRSRKRLWHKGETSGNIQKVVSIMSDCDNDSILMRVIQTGAACHTGSYSCFFNNRQNFDDVPNIDILKKEFDRIAERAKCPQEGSYTNYLLNSGKEKICKKVGEEASECIIAAMKGDNSELASEVCDLLYHIMVLMTSQKLSLTDILKVMKGRFNTERRKNY